MKKAGAAIRMGLAAPPTATSAQLNSAHARGQGLPDLAGSGLYASHTAGTSPSGWG